jgi:hypothetical protein
MTSDPCVGYGSRGIFTVALEPWKWCDGYAAQPRKLYTGMAFRPFAPPDSSTVLQKVGLSQVVPVGF